MKFNIPKDWLLKRAHLEEGLDIAAGVPTATLSSVRIADWRHFPVKEMYKRNWFQHFTGSLNAAISEADALVSYFVKSAVDRPVVSLQKQRLRAGGKVDPYALFAWQCRVLVLAKADQERPKNEFKASALDKFWMRELVQLSSMDDGPAHVKEFLNNSGIAFVVEPHLPSTHLDGAALLGESGPIIALTLRYDRLDNFWFVLFHEIIHVKKHLKRGSVEDIFDDLEAAPDTFEEEADALAGEALIPSTSWQTALARFVKSEGSVKAFANAHKIHPAIVAGRIRKDEGNYVILNGLVGQGEVRKHFPHIAFGKI